MGCGRGAVVPKPSCMRGHRVFREIYRKINLQQIDVRQAIHARMAGTPLRINKRLIDAQITFHHGIDRKRRIRQFSTFPTQALAHRRI